MFEALLSLGHSLDLFKETRLANLSQPLLGMAGVKKGNLIYSYGGRITAGTDLGTLTTYDVSTNTYGSLLASNTRAFHAGVMDQLQENIYFHGGRRGTAAPTQTDMVYNIAGNTWSNPAN